MIHVGSPYWRKQTVRIPSKRPSNQGRIELGTLGSNPDITQILDRVSIGSHGAADELLQLVYPELRALAANKLRNESPNHTLQATALVHEAYLRLLEQRESTWKNRAHFFALAAQAIHRILIDHARGKKSQKRGGGALRVTLEGVPAKPDVAGPDLLALDEALNELQTLDERQSRIVILRYFGGLSMPEVAEALGVSLRTAEGEWALARAWLRVRLREEASQ